MVKKSLFVFLLFFSVKAFTQSEDAVNIDYDSDTIKVYERAQIESLYELYSLNIDPTYELINGTGYFQYYYLSNVKPVLFLDKIHSSSVTLNGRRYNDIDLDLDTYTDDVIYIDSSRICIFSPLRVALNKDNVDGFEFYQDNDTLTFRLFRKKNNPSFNLNDGYYEVVYDGESKYLIKHISYLKRLPGNDEYIYEKENYVNAGNGFSKIGSRKQFVKLFGDYSSDVREFMEESGIKIRNSDKKDIMSVLKYYDSIDRKIK